MADNDPQFDFSDLFTAEKEDTDFNIEPINIETMGKDPEFDFSNLFTDYSALDTEKQLAYGFLQEPQIFGTIGRGIKAVGRSIFSDQTVGEAFREVEGERQENIFKRYPEFKDLKEEDEPLGVIAGRATGAFSDLATWLIPWTKVLVFGKVGLAATGAAVGAGETALREYALYGDIKAQNVAISAVFGGSTSVLGDIAGTKIAGYLANRKAAGQATNAMEEILNDVKVVDNIIPSALIPNNPEEAETVLKPMRELLRERRISLDRSAREKQGEIFLTSESPQIDFVRAANRALLGRKQSMTVVNLTPVEETALQTASEKIIKRAAAQEKETPPVTFIAETSSKIKVIDDDLTSLYEAKKIAEKAKDENTIADVEKRINSLKSKREEYRNTLVEDVVNLSGNKADTAVDVLEDMAETNTLTESIMRKVIYETARPVGFGIGGAAIGFSRMEEDDGWGHVLAYTGAGISLGLIQKRIQRSTTLTDIDKKTGELVVQDAGKGWLGNAAKHLKYITGGNTAARMDAYGGWNKIIGNRLFSALGSNVESIEARTQRLQADYLEELFKITGAPAERSFVTRAKRALGSDVNYDIIDEKNKAINVIASELMRGYIQPADLVVGYKGLRKDLKAVDAEDIKEIERIVPLLIQLRDKTAARVEEAGIKFNKIENYGLHQVWDRVSVDDNYAEFLVDLQDAVVIQETNRFKKAGKDPSTLDIPKIKEKAKVMAEKIAGRYVDPTSKTYAGGVGAPVFEYNKDTEQYLFRATSNAFEKQRMLTDIEATKFMYEKGYLNLHAGDAMASSGTNAIKVAEFAEAFGADGELIIMALQKTREGFKKAMDENPDNDVFLKKNLAAYESQLTGAIEAYWGVYGKTLGDNTDVVTRAFTTLANVTYLTTVSIANLGDLIQPFTNSSYSAAVKTLAQRMRSEKIKFSEQSSFKYDKAYEKDLSAFMRKSSSSKVGQRIDNINDFYFFTVQLSRVTEMSRNFAYDVGVNRAFELAKKTKLSKKELAEVKGLKLTTDELKIIGKFDTVEDAFKNDKAIGNLLSKAGRSSADRDAIIPSVGNRLLFAQTNNTAVRAVGQFMSWAQAKTTQANYLLSRVENGDAQLALKILAATPIYAGFLELKNTLNPYYKVEDNADNKSESIQYLNAVGKAMKLSGSYNNAILDKTIGALTSIGYGKGAESLVPSMNLLFEAGKGAFKVGEDISEGETLKALKRIVVSAPVISQASALTEKITGEPLISVEDKKTKQRAIFKEGGEVLNVPNVPTEPDQRIDKMTGLPYDVQAGDAFIDNEDPLRRLGFKGGGYVTDPLKRLGFGN